LIPVALFLCLACARLPQITPVAGAPASGTGPGACSVFPQGDWQFLHSITAELPPGGSFAMMGLTVISSRLRTNRSVIMTFEGFVVFDGEHDGGLIVHRALPPFDAPHFARGLMEDIRLIFFEPDGPLVAAGELENGSAVCRYQDPEGGFVDVELRRDRAWELRRYSPAQRLTRTVKIPPGLRNSAGFPAAIELTAHGSQNYKLVMRLVEAVPFEPTSP
jgi:hypothetical protein